MYDLLHFRRQFLLSNGLIDELQSWQHRQVGDVHLFAHPDLEITVEVGSSASVLLLGYIFDPVHPEKSNEDIVSDILSRAANLGDLITIIKPYAGRYALIYRDNATFAILHDPLGLREIYYCTQQNIVICGSQPNLLVHFSNPRIHESSDPELLEFVQNHLPRVRNGRLWPGDGTPYEAVKHLLPNHYLDLTRMESCRYWPNTALSRIELEEAVSKCTAFLQGAMKAAAHRHSLMMAVTAGLDSRALLAASKEISNSIYFFINKHATLSDRSGEIRIPKEIFRRIGIPFNVHTYPKDVPEEFKRIFLDNTFYAKEILLPAIYNIYFNQHSDKVNILGVGEVGRTKFYEDPKNLTPYYLAYMLKYKKSSFAVRECEKWLSGAEPIAKKFGLNIMTMFWWEVLIGNWGSVGNSESDIAIEEFDPYNSHLLYETFLSTDAKYRTLNDNILFEEMIRFMWPELLSVPANPPEHIKDWLMLFLHKSHLEIPFRMIKYNIHSFLYHWF